ncbi:DUF302 domain-containing protein [Kordiimonas sp. SCSIO 12610]|uniref:DUF302 domain-containing protein n=1 Tax=Kordiimonas sp. SCSIO 12610 TaxID=2829597 RepID=UPI00210D66AA|nr:DUF302 domain-containing protein [Kordiimonas sp. SCSIO 12610]UTW56471.1 DUF302 domain-containing protein [Kordiimonas sp. SCSIO 12610]
MNTVIHTAVKIGLAILLVISVSTQIKAGGDTMDVKSKFSFSETVTKLEEAITSRGLKVIAKVDHAKGAAAAELELRPTLLVLFGHPKAGTPLMQINQRVGLDLPLRVVVWEDSEGSVMLTYREPAFVSDAWELDPVPPQIGGMTKAIAAITAEAAGE